MQPEYRICLYYTNEIHSIVKEPDLNTKYVAKDKWETKHLPHIKWQPFFERDLMLLQKFDQETRLTDTFTGVET